MKLLSTLGFVNYKTARIILEENPIGSYSGFEAKIMIIDLGSHTGFTLLGQTLQFLTVALASIDSRNVVESVDASELAICSKMASISGIFFRLGLATRLKQYLNLLTFKQIVSTSFRLIYKAYLRL